MSVTASRISRLSRRLGTDVYKTINDQRFSARVQLLHAEFELAPVGFYEIWRQNNDRFLTAVNGIGNVIGNRCSWHKVSGMNAQAQAIFIFTYWDNIINDKPNIFFSERNKGIEYKFLSSLCGISTLRSLR